MRTLFSIVYCLILAANALSNEVVHVDYDEQVAPILKRHCLQCHGESKQEAGLDLSSFASVLRGGSGGAVVVAGRSNSSRIIEALTSENPDARMPPDNDPLPTEQIQLIKDWIDLGLKEDRASKAMEIRSIGFIPTANTSEVSIADCIPVDLPDVFRKPTQRPFPILGLAASPAVPLIASAGYERIDFFRGDRRELIGSIPFSAGEPHVLKYSATGKILLAAGGLPVQHGKACLFEVKTGKLLATYGDEIDAIMAADIAPNEQSIAIGGSGRVVKLISTLDGSLIATLTKHTDWITSLAYSPDGKLLATGDRIGNIHLWDAVNGGVYLPLAEHKATVRSLSWRSDSKILASVGEDGLIVWWDVEKGFPLRSIPNAHPPQRVEGDFGKIANGILDASFGSGVELISCGRDGRVRIWSEEGRELRLMNLDAKSRILVDSKFVENSTPIKVVLSSDGSLAFAGDTVGQIFAWPIDK